MKIQFIFSMQDKPQLITEYENFYPALLTDKNVFLTYACSRLGADISSLTKISTCIVGDNGNVPDWYYYINGKFWVDDLEKWRLENLIQSSVSKEFIAEFMATNY
jgi:hypothetical protein